MGWTSFRNKIQDEKKKRTLIPELRKRKNKRRSRASGRQRQKRGTMNSWTVRQMDGFGSCNLNSRQYEEGNAWSGIY